MIFKSLLSVSLPETPSQESIEESRLGRELPFLRKVHSLGRFRESLETPRHLSIQVTYLGNVFGEFWEKCQLDSHHLPPYSHVSSHAPMKWAHLRD